MPGYRYNVILRSGRYRIQIYFRLKKIAWQRGKKSNQRNEDKNLKTINDVLCSHRQRKRSDNKRYKKYYNIDVYNKINYDFVLDTTNLSKRQVFSKVYSYIKPRLAKKKFIDKL